MFMKIILSFSILFLYSQSICFSQTLPKEESLETDTFFMWEVLDLKQAENTGFMYQNCNFKNLLLEGVQLGIIRPFSNDSLQIRLSQEDFLNRTNQKKASNKIILKSKVRYKFDEIIYQDVIAISLYTTEGKLICVFSYKELKANLLLDNSDAIICLGENLKVSLVEVFENRYFKTKFLRKVKIE